MNQSPILLCLWIFLTGVCFAQTPRHWPLDGDGRGYTVRGAPTHGVGVKGPCLVFDGDALVRLTDTETMPTGSFTVSLWFNPYDVGGSQQMIAGKNRYSLGEREWSLTAETNGHLRLHVRQEGWLTITSKRALRAGAWHRADFVIEPQRAALFLDGTLQGEVSLRTPVALTGAPITLGGIWDADRMQQTFVGAVDEVRIDPRALTAAEIAATYAPEGTMHALPKAAQAAIPLWDEAGPLPRSAELEQVRGVQFHVIKRERPDVDDCMFTLGVGLAWHRGLLFASYAFNKGPENTATEEAHVRVSRDGGKTWGPAEVMDAGEADLAVSHGVFLSHRGTLWAFMGAFHAHEKLYHRVHARAYVLDEGSKKWASRGVIADGGFWPMQEPQQMSDGNWIMAGLRIGGGFGEAGNLPAVAISKGDDFLSWEVTVIPPAAGVRRNVWGESTVIVEGCRVLNIARYGAQAAALLSVSEDCGRTWTPTAPSNLMMATSKPYAGILSTGQRYLVCTTTADTGGARSPLTIAVSRPGEKVFSKVYLVRRSVCELTPGVSAEKADFSYPYAVEHDGNLYIGYTHKSHGANELAIVPVASLSAAP